MSIFSRGTIVIQHRLDPLGHGGHQSCTGCYWSPLPLLHNDITELLDVTHMVLLHLPLEDAPHVLDRVQVWRQTWPVHHLQLSSRRCVWSGYVGKQFLKEGHHLLLQNVTVHVGSMFPSMNRSSPEPAVDMQPQTMMQPPSRLTEGKAEVSWYSSPARRHTCWTPSESNKFTLDLIRPQDMVPVSHALGQVVFSKLFAGFLVSQLQKRRPSGTTVMQTDLLQCVAYCLSTDNLTVKQCCQHSCVCFLKPASAPDAQHKDSTSLIHPCEACSEWNPS